MKAMDELTTTYYIDKFDIHFHQFHIHKDKVYHILLVDIFLVLQ